MLESKRVKQEDAHQKARDRFSKASGNQAEMLKEKEKRTQADAAKTAKLRALRLEKEAADKEILAKAAAEKKLVAVHPKRSAPAKARKPASKPVGEPVG